MSDSASKASALTAWTEVCAYVANGHASEFAGQKKETNVFRRVRAAMEARHDATMSIIGPDQQEAFTAWRIDLVVATPSERLAIEGKYKLASDQAITDNRKEAFFDLFKLEQYVASGRYAGGLFLWLTDEPRYLKQTAGTSADFSTHDGRVYRSGTPLNATRARSKSMPLPLVLRGNYIFTWREVVPQTGWHSLEIHVNVAGYMACSRRHR